MTKTGGYAGRLIPRSRFGFLLGTVLQRNCWNQAAILGAGREELLSRNNVSDPLVLSTLRAGPAIGDRQVSSRDLLRHAEAGTTKIYVSSPSNIRACGEAAPAMSSVRSLPCLLDGR